MLESTSHTITKKDVLGRLPSRMLNIKWPQHMSVEQWCYARMDPSSPLRGLATAGVSSCTVVILHCPKTQRTILSHSPNFLQMNTFVPMIKWAVGGDGQNDIPTERLGWRYGFATPSTRHSGVVLEAVVFRGKMYGTPAAKDYGHDGWISDFRELCSDIEKSQSLKINVVDDPRILHTSAIAVEKGSGRLTLFDMGNSFGGHTIGAISESATSFRDTSPQVLTRNLFVGNFWYVQQQTFDIHLQYDVDRTLPGIPLPDQAREIIRSVQLGEPESFRVDMLRKFGHPDWISGAGGGTTIAALSRKLLDDLGRFGMPCETCLKPGTSKCSRCRGAWYCGAAHQGEDWKAHKSWCKGHTLN
ncbi:hypothetical protein PM082_012848 [Marasmius tenuissimus]|nr:hypothetical protein PM082_012848 [Marasmius tenuissimus]